MGVNKFFVFKEDGTLARLKSSISRFLDNDPPDNDDKVNIRASISVPASAEGLTPANNLSDVSSVETARSNLSVNSIDEDAQANALKTTAPALYFNTSSTVVVADDTKFTFSDGTDDLPFSIEAFVNVSSYPTNFYVFSAWTSNREFITYLDNNGKLTLGLSDGTNDTYAVGNTAVPVNQWTHVCIVYPGAGPNSVNGFNANQNGTTMYINGVAETVTPTNNNSYGGLVNRTQSQSIGYGSGHLRAVRVYNRELTASEVAQLARGNDLGFSEEWGGANGGVYTSDFSNPDVGGDEDLDGFAGGNATADGNIDSIGGEDDNLRLTIDTTANAHAVYRSSVFTANKRYRVDFDFYIPLSNTALDGLIAYCGTSDIVEIGSYPSPSVNAWNRFSGEFVATATANADRLIVYATDGGATGFSDGGAGTDVLYIRNIKITEIGTLADFRSEDYNESASKLLDRSSNNFVGVGTSVTLTGNQRHISADTIDLKNLPTSSAGLSAGEVWSNSGVLTVV